MTTYGYVLPGAVSIARSAQRAQGVTKRARQRLQIIDWYHCHRANKSLASRHFGITRETLIIWLKRLKQYGPVGLNDRSHRPHKVRQPTTPWEIRAMAIEIRKENPTWSKYKIAAALGYQGLKIHSSTVERILKRRGLIQPKISRKKQRAALHPKKRFPRDLIIKEPGDLIQMDTKHLIGIGGRRLYQFTAIDVLTKIRVLWAAPSLSSKQGERFLNHCMSSFPFPIKAIQTDNGSEFLKYFDMACTKLSIPHYFTEPKSPKQNSYVERSHSTDEQDFYQQGNMRSTVAQLLPLLKEWESTYNTRRPHQSLNYLTPMHYFLKYQKGRIPTRDYIPLQT